MIQQRTFASFASQHSWTSEERAYRAGEQAGHLGSNPDCPDALTGCEEYWANGYAYGKMMRGQLLPHNEAVFPLL